MLKKMLADTFKYMDQAIWSSINRFGNFAISKAFRQSVHLFTWICRCPAKTISENLYHTCCFQLKDIRIYYLIWEDLCMTLMKTKGVRIPRKLKWATSIAILILFLAAALWKVIVDRESKSRAKKQFSIRFGHIPFGPTTAMDRFFTEWQPQQVYLKQ